MNARPDSDDGSHVEPEGDDENAVRVASDDAPRLGEEGVTKADFVLETGLRPHEYVLELLDESPRGKLLQQEVIGLTGWSESYVSRTLGEMEAEGHVVRVRFGRENVVYLPDAAPDARVGSRANVASGDRS